MLWPHGSPDWLSVTKLLRFGAFRLDPEHPLLLLHRPGGAGVVNSGASSWGAPARGQGGRDGFRGNMSGDRSFKPGAPPLLPLARQPQSPCGSEHAACGTPGMAHAHRV
jgi:hypothetical protein